MPLSRNDAAVLQQVFDPEAAPTAGILIDESLPKDPHADPATLESVVAEERQVIRGIEAAMKDSDAEGLANAISKLKALIQAHPKLGCLHNDLAQALRLQHGDQALGSQLIDGASDSAALQVMDALNQALSLLSPPSPQAAVSPTQCRTLAQAHMQRAAVYRAAAKGLKGGKAGWKEWTEIDFEEAASRDFFMGGRYGNEIGKAMAVHTNPTAKLCGQMVQDAMRRELSQQL